MIEQAVEVYQSPIDKLIALAEYAKINARPLPTQFEMGDFWSGVGFTLSGVRFVVPIEQISEMMKVPRFSYIPGVQSWVKGVSNVRGQLVPIFDISPCFNLVAQEMTQNSRILIIQEDDWSAGVIVDAVSGMQHFPIEMHENHIDNVPSSLVRFTNGQYTRDDKRWVVLSLKDICLSEQFKELAL